jgi:hypothetical protein
MTVAIGDFLLRDSRLELPGIAEPVLAAKLYQIIRQFFWESEAWKYTYDNGLDWTITETAVPEPVAGTDIPAKCVVKRVDTIHYDAGGDSWDTLIPFLTRDELDRKNSDWNVETGTSPGSWTTENGGIARIIPIPSATVTTGLLIRSIIAPVFTAITDTLPDFLYYEHEAVLKAGILGQLMAQVGKDWSNPQQAGIYQQAYGAGIIKAKSRSEADFGQPKDSMAYGGI